MLFSYFFFIGFFFFYLHLLWRQLIKGLTCIKILFGYISYQRKQLFIKNASLKITVKFFCNICEKPVPKNHQIQCDSCNLWIQIKYKKLTRKPTKAPSNSNVEWYFIKCFANIIPFKSFQINSYLKLIKAKKIKFKTITKRLPDHSLTDILNSAIDDTNNDLVANKYFEPNEISSVIKKHLKLHFFILIFLLYLTTLTTK